MIEVFSLFLQLNPTMQALEGSSSGARDALLALSVDLRLSHHAVIKALEYAWDNSSSHSDAAAALDFGFIMQGCFVDIRVLDMALQRLRRNFGSQCCGAYRRETGLIFQGILGVSTAQHVSLAIFSACIPHALHLHACSYQGTSVALLF